MFFPKVYSEVVPQGQKSFKRFINTIVDLLPSYIDQYPPNDQLLLREFLAVLQHYNEADYQRKNLSQRFKEYCDSLLGTDQYIQTAFLWFVFTYFSNAHMLLNISKFHAYQFYEYLVRHLRGHSSVPGVFSLIRENVTLTNLIWEQLQYESQKLIVPLTDNQIQILKQIYASLKEGVHVLDSRRLRTIIINQVEFPKNVKSNEEFTRFFSLIDGQWRYRFFDPAFGLDWVILQIQLQEFTSLEDIIDFQTSRNTVISTSDVYFIRNLPNSYLGILRVPSQDFDQLKGFFQRCERQGGLILESFERITTRSFWNSLTHYRTGAGWVEQSPTRMRRLTQLLQTQNPKKKLIEYPSLFTPPPFNSHWHFSDHPLPKELIKVLCDLSPHTYSYQTLPLNNQEFSSLSQTDIGLLRQLYYNQVVQIRFIPWQLVNEFSLDLYCVILPKIPDFQLKHFLNLIPYGDVIFTEETIYIWCRLTPKLVQWVENDLHWTVFPTIRKIVPLRLEFKFFDPLELQWRIPQFLKDER